jgi:hypothetical protein
MFPEGTGVVRSDVVFAGEFLLDAKEARGGTVAVCSTVFGPADVAVVFVDGCNVRATTLSTCKESF